MSTTKKQSSLHSFFAKKTTSKENDSKNATAASSSTAAAAVASAAASTVVVAVDDGSTRTQVLPSTMPTLMNTASAAVSAIDETTLSKRKNALKELQRKKRRVLDDEDDDSSDEDEDPKDTSNRTVNKNIEASQSTENELKSAPRSSESTCKGYDSLTSTNASSNQAKSKSSSAAAKASGSIKAAGESASNKKLVQPTMTANASKLTVATSSSSNDSHNPTNSSDKQVSIPTTTIKFATPSPLAKALKSKTDQDLVQEAQKSWAKDLVGNELPYAVLCETWSRIEAISSRLQIQEILTSLFRTCLLLNVDLLPVIYLCCNEVAPAYKCVELGIGDAILIRAIAEATGSSPATIKSQYEAQGDLGNVAQSAKGSQKTLGGFFKSTKQTKGLTAPHVLQVFQQIATTKGNQSQKWKTDCIKKLLVSADGKKEETRYIIRGLQGKLRIGLAESTVLISLAHAVVLSIPESVRNNTDTLAHDDNLPDEAQQYMDVTLAPEKRVEAAVTILKKAYSEVPSYEALLNACLKVPLQLLHKACTLTPGIPVAPMLAKPTKSVQEVLKRLNGLKFTCEYKYDGERAQVHMLPDGSTKVFSRNLLDTSEKYPEVPLFVKEAAVYVQSFVLDAEVVAFNNKTGQLVPFQVLSTRKKTEESAETAKVQVIVQAFDLMFLNGKSLLSNTLEERRKLLHQHFKAVPGKFQFATSMDHEENGDTAIIEEFLDGAVKGQCEGLMIKTLNVNANYEPSRRSLNWLKLKKDYLEGLGDSVDLVPLGAYFGRGKRTGVYGAYLLACYDPDTEEFQSVCKIGTGFSDEDLKTLAANLNQHIIPKKSSQYNTTDQLECDVWFDAVQVWEVKAADLSKSSAHRGAEGKIEEGRGIGLRFPRFERIRDDKRPEDATTSDQILEMYYAQDSIVDNGDNDDDGI